MIALTLFLTVIISLTTVSGECPNGWIRFDKSCYRLFRQSPQSWPEAVFACEQHDAFLASIETKVENGHLQELIAESNVLKTDNVWIGLSDVREEGVFVWESTRQTATFLPWGKHEPNQPADLQEDCVMLFGRQEHTFADAACEIKYSYLCERPLNGVLPVVG
ncbi:macrophage mannose receptor 1-like [Haliotis rufescens]|uniref:macrophage mannose receptor 1-like n=1 Tax=Haliotis rufescens TaxID=6454 RepID=UPI00201E8ACC|nr:macrophage mannose receptor 1-like [Haliotis rufescens]